MHTIRVIRIGGRFERMEIGTIKPNGAASRYADGNIYISGDDANGIFTVCESKDCFVNRREAEVELAIRLRAIYAELMAEASKLDAAMESLPCR